MAVPGVSASPGVSGAATLCGAASVAMEVRCEDGGEMRSGVGAVATSATITDGEIALPHDVAQVRMKLQKV